MHDAEYTAKCIPDITVAMSVSNENLLRAQKFVTSLSFYTLNAIETPVLAPVCVRSRACASVRLNPIIRPRTCMYVCVRAHTCAFVHVRLHPCPYVCVRALASAFVRVRASTFVCVHIIKSPDASARIISDASGRVFRSRTFEVYYKYRTMAKVKTIGLVL